MKANNSAQEILKKKKPWDDNTNSIWLASTVSLHRNIEKFKFPGKLGADRKKQIISLVSKEVLKLPQLTNPILIKAEELGILEKEFLGEHFLSSHSYNQAHAGEGFILDDTGELLIDLNIKDHIKLELIDCKGELENTWSKLVKIETSLGKTINYSFLPKFGFLTADPTQAGTALTISVFLQLPGLIHSGTIDDILEKYADESIIISGIQGSPTEIIGDIIVAQNNYTLGLTEENIVSSLRNFTTKMMLEETAMRNSIKKNDSSDFKDKISRAFGILNFSYQIETIEALNALSLLKMGIEAKWITGIDVKTINSLFFNCRRGHLLNIFSEKIVQDEVAHKRSEYIHKVLKPVSLAI